MRKFLLAIVITMTQAYASCPELYATRSQSLSAAQEAFNCYESLSTSQDRLVAADALAKMSYLKFTIAEFFLELKLDALYEAFMLGEKAVLLYGPKYAVENYAGLSQAEKEVIAFGYYTYGVSLSRYVDLKGKLEAIRRKEDILKSMTSILRMGQESVAFGGALRTLAIFHTKVPSIAGGQIQLAQPYAEKAIALSLFRGKLSRYPGNNLARAEVLFKLGKGKDSCEELKGLVALTESDLRAMDNSYTLETLKDLDEARSLAKLRKCL